MGQRERYRQVGERARRGGNRDQSRRGEGSDSREEKSGRMSVRKSVCFKAGTIGKRSEREREREQAEARADGTGEILRKGSAEKRKDLPRTDRHAGTRARAVSTS